jgi:hypothetical protein
MNHLPRIAVVFSGSITMPSTAKRKLIDHSCPDDSLMFDQSNQLIIVAVQAVSTHWQWQQRSVGIASQMEVTDSDGCSLSSAINQGW